MIPRIIVDQVNNQTLQTGIINKIKAQYGIMITSWKPIWSYYGGVFEITVDTNSSYILKIIRNPDEYKLRHLEAEVAFTQAVTENITEFITQTFIQDKNENELQKSNNDMFYLLKKHEIIKKSVPTPQEQQHVGRLIHAFHTKLVDFKHEGIAGTSWMREVEPEQYKILLQNMAEKEFAPFVAPLNYEESHLTKTLIHGDWHDDNFSFSTPPFLYDLDTLSYGAASEEIARTITHWTNDDLSIKDFYENILVGYRDLSQDEIDVIPRVAVAICLRQFAEITQNGDKYNDARGFLELEKKLKSLFCC
ncbi:hypothetical protein A2690_02465 [Candidatus Roizmanbacteria bacterium RIFCSPHIGHO2_01_FULL_39_12b]|uniref:Aminoglycoside phosphotransferase domain-containing protein n=1 Tax=Candidatus Roizmanbacteria bacterium RIFCSPHIGHO2_01_FULL_39_12b TaxID=1802030 RepID=A0A1F7GDI1_9BACT|nr:MAG: hypothetical protein A2690_02465 [Candidatus Roizmanbacteria bacterium RIFCSPHIGHO2_01_FULL_39_12b]OGK46638.1 MAG: hypothetical protein A3B46_00335 [Candidatus Roizmanbacteria bacterium RIFCSPLOWO2_01_FULL_39_19]